MDIEILYKVEKDSRKNLPLEIVGKSPIDFFVKVFNVREKTNEYISCKDHILEKLKASSCATPFFPSLVLIDGNEYADSSALSNHIDDTIQRLANDSNNNVVCVFNNPIKSMLKPTALIGNFLWAILVGIYFGDFKLFLKKANVFSRYKKIISFSKLENVTIIENDLPISVFSTNKDLLLSVFENGKKKGWLFTRTFLSKHTSVVNLKG